MSMVNQTMFAAKALGLAELFKHAVGKQAIAGGGKKWAPELSAPDGESTAGGRQALQHIKLVPHDGGPTLVIGSAHQVDMVAELRTYAHVDALHRRRFKGEPFPIDKASYDELIGRMQGFLSTRGLKVTLADEVPAADEDAPTTPLRAPPKAMFVFAATAVVVAAGLIALLR